jgi:flavodoxin
MKYVIVYWSTLGNGKRLVEHLDKTLKNKGATGTLLKTDQANPSSLPPADIYIFSAPAEALNLQKNMRTFMKDLKGTDGKPYGIINTHGMKKNRLDKMEKLLSKKAMVKRASLDFQVSGDVKNANGLPEGWETSVDEFATKLNG